MVRDGIVHDASPAIMPSAITRSLGLEPNSGEVSGALASVAIRADDLALGRWDAARVRLSAVDWSDEGAEEVALLAGELGDVAIDGERFTAELHGAARKLQEAPCP